MKWLLLDATNLCHRSFHVLQHMRNGVIYGVLRDILFLQDVHDTDKIVFCFDSKTNLRKEVYPQYKANHTTEGKEDLYRQIALLRLLLKKIGFSNVFAFQGYEADDLVAQACLQLDKDDTAVIVSTDNDLWQCLSTQVTIWNPITKWEMTKERFEKEEGLTTSQWLVVKAIMGDKGDNLPGIPGIGPAKAKAYVLGKANPVIANNPEAIDRNIPLMRLPYEGTPELDLRPDNVKLSVWDWLVQKYGFSLRGVPRGAN